MQVVIYDKRAELLATRKLALLESYGFNPCDKEWRLYRVEVRYAGDVLKRRWTVRNLPALRANLQAMLHKALTRIRYVLPRSMSASNDAEMLHPLWQRIIETIPLASCDQPSQFAPERAQHLIDSERMRSLKANIAGCAFSLAAMQTSEPTKIAKLAPVLASAAVANAVVVDPDKPFEAVRRENSRRAKQL